MLHPIRDKIFPEPLSPLGSYSNQTVVVIGGTSGLGLAAAIQFARLGASTIIITCRNATRGESAKRKIKLAAGISWEGKVEIMELDMIRYSSSVSFVEKLKKSCGGKGGVDCAVLNAGGVTL